MDTDRARELLTGALADLDDRARFAADSAAQTAEGDEPATDGALNQHSGDVGTEVANHMENEGLLRTIGEQRRRVQDALARVEAGTFGRCAVCDRAIDDERLEARPEVLTCREHADSRVPA